MMKVKKNKYKMKFNNNCKEKNNKKVYHYCMPCISKKFMSLKKQHKLKNLNNKKDHLIQKNKV